uniref:Uncharacterized protein n=1 Tax=Salix viminalis TaxID=40686 RepID=A0A6N2MTT4_SALVM
MPVDLTVEGRTLRHGISLHTLVRKSAALSGPCFLVPTDITHQHLAAAATLLCAWMETCKLPFQEIPV